MNFEASSLAQTVYTNIYTFGIFKNPAGASIASEAAILQEFRMGRCIDWNEGGLLCVGILEGEDECVRPVMMDGRGLRGS